MRGVRRMKKTLFGCMLLIVICSILSGCSSSHSTASWVYPFVIVNGVSYGVPATNDEVIEVNKSEVGNKIGAVKRNVVNMDTGASKYVQKNFDSNILKKGTPLYQYSKDNNAIIYENNGKFYLAKKVKN
jgi:hypothetical protein